MSEQEAFEAWWAENRPSDETPATEGVARSAFAAGWQAIRESDARIVEAAIVWEECPSTENSIKLADRVQARLALEGKGDADTR